MGKILIETEIEARRADGMRIRHSVVIVLQIESDKSREHEIKVQLTMTKNTSDRILMVEMHGWHSNLEKIRKK